MSLDKFDPNKGKKEVPQEMIVSSEEIKNLTAKLQEETVKFGSEHPETALWIYDHLNAIKYSGLQGAFKNVIESVHGSFDPERIVSPERTYIVKNEEAIAVHNTEMGITAIDGPFFRALEDKKTSLILKTATLLHLVTHENTHAAGKIEYRELSGGASLEKTGYRESILHGPTTSELFNEGVTEIITKRVAEEYLIGFPMMLEDGSILDIGAYQDFLRTYHREHLAPEDYVVAEEFVNSLSVHIARGLSTTPELILNAFISGYFRGTEDFFQNTDFLDQIMGPGFSEKVRSARFAEDLERIVREHKMPPIGQDIQEEIEKLLKEFLAKK